MTRPVPSESAPAVPASESPPILEPNPPEPVVHPPVVSAPLSGPPSPPRAAPPRDATPTAPTRDGKALIYGGLAFSVVTIAVRVPLTTQLRRVGNPADALIYGNVVNLVAVGAITTLVFGAVRRGHYLAHGDVVVHGKRRRQAKPFIIGGWTLFGIGLGTFAVSRLLAPLSCDLVNPCEFRGLEAAWYLSFVMVAAGGGLGSFGVAYRDRARSYEQQRRIAITPWLDRSRAGVGVSGRF
ncbi:MAG: hypothetical protein IAG13_08835 [Deltaproteobacteria bacterium]|nr:hypothetical protein [Nannocystaceae bacterium]